MFTDSWPTFSNGRVWYWAGPSYQPPSATEWPHYITTNWPQVVPQKVYRCEDKQISFDLPLFLGKACVSHIFWGFISHAVYMYQLWVSDEMQFCVTSFWLYLMQIQYCTLFKWNSDLIKSNHIIGVKWCAPCLHVTNDSSSLKWHKGCKKVFHCCD